MNKPRIKRCRKLLISTIDRRSYIHCFGVVVVNAPERQIIFCSGSVLVEDIIRQAVFRSELSIGPEAVNEFNSRNLTIMILIDCLEV